MLTAFTPLGSSNHAWMERKVLLHKRFGENQSLEAKSEAKTEPTQSVGGLAKASNAGPAHINTLKTHRYIGVT